jgi:hypothetical protein
MRGVVANWTNAGVHVIVRHSTGEGNYDWQKLGQTLPPAVDQARDIINKVQHGHPGRKTMQVWANVIADEIRVKRLG